MEDANVSDDDTVEFDIEVITSSSSSNSLADAAEQLLDHPQEQPIVCQASDETQTELVGACDQQTPERSDNNRAVEEKTHHNDDDDHLQHHQSADNQAQADACESEREFSAECNKPAENQQRGEHALNISSDAAPEAFHQRLSCDDEAARNELEDPLEPNEEVELHGAGNNEELDSPHERKRDETDQGTIPDPEPAIDNQQEANGVQRSIITAEIARSESPLNAEVPNSGGDDTSVVSESNLSNDLNQADVESQREPSPPLSPSPLEQATGAEICQADNSGELGGNDERLASHIYEVVQESSAGAESHPDNLVIGSAEIEQESSAASSTAAAAAEGVEVVEIVPERIECQLVSEPHAKCPDGWSLVAEADEFGLKPLERLASFTTEEPTPLRDAASDKTTSPQGEEEEEEEDDRVVEVVDADSGLIESSRAGDDDANQLDDSSGHRRDDEQLDRESVCAEHEAQLSDVACEQPQQEPELELIQHQPVDISVELASDGGENMAAMAVIAEVNEVAKTPQVVILSGDETQVGGADCLSDCDPLSHSPISIERQDFSSELDEFHDSLGLDRNDEDDDGDDDHDDHQDEDEDLEREFDEEPEFERREVVVKRNCDVRAEYALGAELGRGKFGTVYRCTEQASGRQLAAKFIAMRRREDRDDVEREVAIMSVLQHKRLLQLYDAFDDSARNEMCLITELVEGGELFERIVDDDFDLTEKKAAIFMRQICEGVEYMHGQQIVHLDMKPENILCLSRTGNRIKLIDFGLARRLDPKHPIRVMFGTPDFAAPEVLGYETVTLATDMWSVGVICYVLLSGLSPFMGESDMDTMANVTRATYDFNDQAFEPISELAKDFIRKLLLRNPNDRLPPGACLKHAWLQRGGAQLEAAVRESRRESLSTTMLLNSHQKLAMEQLMAAATADMTPAYAAAMQHHRASFGGESTTSSGLISLDKRRLKRYVVRRKWHKTVHAIMALNRMGANLNKLVNL